MGNESQELAVVEKTWDAAIQIVKDAKERHAEILETISPVDERSRTRFLQYIAEDENVIFDLETAKIVARVLSLPEQEDNKIALEK